MHGKQILSIGQCVSECKGGSQYKVIFFRLTCILQHPFWYVLVTSYFCIISGLCVCAHALTNESRHFYIHSEML